MRHFRAPGATMIDRICMYKCAVSGCTHRHGVQVSLARPAEVSRKLPAASVAGSAARSTKAWPNVAGDNDSPSWSVNSATLIPATEACAFAPTAPTAVSGVSYGSTAVKLMPRRRASDSTWASEVMNRCVAFAPA